MPATRALSSPSGVAKEDNVVEWSGAISVKNSEVWQKSVTKLRNYENTEGTSDIGDYVNSILDLGKKIMFVISKQLPA